MRKVLFKIWQDQQYKTPEGDLYNGARKGTNDIFVRQSGFSDFVQEGMFHSWGSTVEDRDNGVATETVGIVELIDGSIAMIYPTHIKFIESYETAIEKALRKQRE